MASKKNLKVSLYPVLFLHEKDIIHAVGLKKAKLFQPKHIVRVACLLSKKIEQDSTYWQMVRTIIHKVLLEIAFENEMKKQNG